MVAPGINDLDRVLRIVMECDRYLVQQGFPAIRRHSVTLGKVWWWAQNWAQFFCTSTGGKIAALFPALLPSDFRAAAEEGPRIKG